MPLIEEWNDAIAHVQEVFDRMTDKDPRLVEVRHAKEICTNPYRFVPYYGKAADAIEKLNKRIDFLMNCIYEAEDSLDRGADNDWARAALEKAKRGRDDV